MTYLLDADSVNYLLKKVEPVPTRLNTAVRSGHGFVLSRVVHDQILRYLRLKLASRIEQFYLELTATWTPIELSNGD